MTAWRLALMAAVRAFRTRAGRHPTVREYRTILAEVRA